MLTINNISMLYQKDVGQWKISGIETTANSYLIYLTKQNGEKQQVNIERNPIGDEYEMWCWKTIHHFANSTPERLMVTKDMLRTMDHALTRMNLLMM